MEHRIWDKFSVLNFFIQYANDVPEFRRYVIGQTGIVVLSERIKSTSDDDETDRYSKLLHTVISVANLSCYSYCIPMLADWDLCPALVKELMCVCLPI